MKYLDLVGVAYLVTKLKSIIDGKVDKVSGKGLSANDFTTTEKTKLSKALTTIGGTITGDLRLKGSGNYGNKLNFGDGDYVFLHESSDDTLTIKATKLQLSSSNVTTSTPSSSDNSTKVATTAFVKTAMGASSSGLPIKTTINANGSFTEVHNFGTLNSPVITTTVSSDGNTITETKRNSGGTVLSTKRTRRNSDGSIIEEMI